MCGNLWGRSFIPFLLLIIILRFTCGERKNCSTIKKSQNITNMIVFQLFFGEKIGRSFIYLSLNNYEQNFKKSIYFKIIGSHHTLSRPYHVKFFKALSSTNYISSIPECIVPNMVLLYSFVFFPRSGLDLGI